MKQPYWSSSSPFNPERFGILLLFILFSLTAQAQKVEFAKAEDTVYVEKGKNKVHTFAVNCVGCVKGKEPRFIVKQVPVNLPDSAISFQAVPDTVDFKGKSSVHLYVTVAANNSKNYGKIAQFQLQNITETTDLPKPYFLHVMEPAIEVDSTKYRLMIGTNFDFIDGIKPQSVYYHLQFFTPAAFSRRFGFVGGIQQNRQVSQSDTLFSEVIKGQRRSADSIMLSSYVRVGSDSFRIQRLDSVKFRQTSTATVFQIYFQPTFKIYKLKSPKAQTDIYTFLHGDLTYRRTKFDESYSYKVLDTVVVSRSSWARYATVSNGSRSFTVNNYEYHYGAGVMIHHENKYVDLYAKFMFGGANVGKGEWRGYYGSELGVRVPGINIMFGSEYRGFYNQHDPSYLNVYLSKVVSLSKLFDFILK